ncbi:MAG: NAD-dependent DNA ligase LigA [Treponema sp.]|jgi:DNA ligase (NAD+)|nr:NAD-dependent DNA ligase LigA [Treponema sp.]
MDKAIEQYSAPELEQLIQYHQQRYYSGEAEISDAEFDLYWDRLKEIAPHSALFQHVGAADTDGFPKVPHLIYMGSQEKSAKPEEFCAWAEKIGLSSFIVQHKLDGASIELQYERGLFIRAVTRGNGTVGDDISANALNMKGVVTHLKDESFSGGVRGEVLMTHTVWQHKYSDKANCRNAANGIMHRKDGIGCEDLCVIVYDASNSYDDTFFQTELAKVAWLRAQAFEVVPTVSCNSIEEVIQLREYSAEQRESLAVDIDGLVVKDPHTNPADLRRARPERQIAFKFDLEQVTTVLRAVEWNEVGTTYTPVGIVDPVRIAGTTVHRASLSNPAQVRELGLKIGSTVIVVKRGEIIPKIERVVPGDDSGEEIKVPTVCAVCNTALVDGGTRLYCPNPLCPKIDLHRLQKWINILDIKEIGEMLIRRLFDSGKVRHIADFYALTVEDLCALERIADRSAKKIINHIRSPRALPLATFVAGFDIEGVGELIMERITNAGFNTREKLHNATVNELAAVYGLGIITAQTVVQSLKTLRTDMDLTLSTGIISIIPPPTELPLTGFSFCFTGELITLKRAQAAEKVKARGGTVKSSVVKGLDYLVTNNSESHSSKYKKAQLLGISIINEEDFLNIIDSATAPALSKNSDQKKHSLLSPDSALNTQ